MPYLTLNWWNIPWKSTSFHSRFIRTLSSLTNLSAENSRESFDPCVDCLHPRGRFRRRCSGYSTMQCLLTMVHWIDREKSRRTATKAKDRFVHHQSGRLTMISISSWRFLHVEKIASDVPNSRYHSRFFILRIPLRRSATEIFVAHLLLNFSGCFSRIKWNRWAMDAS